MSRYVEVNRLYKDPIHRKVSGVCAGLAAATKYPAGLVLLPVLASELLRRFTLANRYLWLATLLALCAFSWPPLMCGWTSRPFGQTCL